MIREILQGKNLNSNIAPIARMGRPVRSVYSRAADAIQTPDSRIGILGSAGNWTSGLANALKGGLGFYGAIKDAQAEQAYNDYLAQMAEQERQDKLAQQAWEQDYKERDLAQDLEKTQLAINADNRRAEIARRYALEDAERRRSQEVADVELKRKQALEDRDAQWAHEQSVYDRNRADFVADRNAQIQAAIEAENRKQAYEQEQMAIKQLDPASQQKYFEMKKQGINPVIKDERVGTIGKMFGSPKYSVSDGTQQAEEMPSFDLPLGFGNFFHIGRKISSLKQAQPKAKQQQTINGYTIVQE